MKVRLSKDFRFEASHALEHLSSDHPCHPLHGHSYGVTIDVYGEVDPKTGFLIDYNDIKHAVKPVIDILDHSHLNDVDGLELSTTEYIARFLWNRIKPELPQLVRITIRETATTQCIYEGE